MSDKYAELEQTRMEDWGHEWPAPDQCTRGTFPNCLACGEGLLGDDNYHAACPAKIARFTHKKVIAEIEVLAKEHCKWCNDGKHPSRLGKPESYNTFVHDGEQLSTSIRCLAQPEQRRLAQLRAQLLSHPGDRA